MTEVFSFQLLSWFQENARKLPWRETSDPYKIWLSEIMLQQTRVAAVVGYYQRFLERLPTISALAECPEDELMKLWQGLGYYNRARNLQKAAVQMMEEHGGVFPQDFDSIRALSGIGDYTAGAIASTAFSLPFPAIDGNVFRIMSRICLDEGDISTPAMKKRVRDWVMAEMPLQFVGNYNQALMELGAVVCLPNGAPLCDICPVSGHCGCFGTEKWRDLPVKPQKKPRKLEHRQVFVVHSHGKVALRQRPKKGLLAGLWEFPHYLDEEELPPYLEKSQEIGHGKHIFTHIEWRMRAFSIEMEENDLPEPWIWVTRQEIQEIYSIPSAFRWVLELLP